MENIITRKIIGLIENSSLLSDEQKNAGKELLWLTDNSIQENLYVLFIKDPTLIEKFVVFGVKEKIASSEKDENKLEKIFHEELKELEKIEAE
ncbi:MAG TPA: hypothetical protein VMC41_02360 [Candidatus Nanoarchaeia archaeon]|nr:hypothetical protein [Candidatus Nanoarchaeia archaeon]